MNNEDGLVIACAFVMELETTGVYHMDYFCVRPEARGNGIGGKFLRSLIEFFRIESKYDVLTLESEAKMVPWYLRQGCHDLGIQSDKWEELKWSLLVILISKSFNDLMGSTFEDASPLDLSNVKCENGATTLAEALADVVFELKSVLAIGAQIAQA